MRETLSNRCRKVSRRAWTAFAFLACVLAMLTPASVARGVTPAYRVTDRGVALEHVSSECPVIYDNDWWIDIPDAAYIWAKASQGKADLRGNIVSRDMWEWQKGYTFKLADGMKQCRELLGKARASGLEHIPDPVAGADAALRRPASGKIEQTQFARSAGSELIVAEAMKASAEKPLLVFCGGPCTTVATAYLTDPRIATRMVVFQVDGGGYNGKDAWSWEIVKQRCVFANWAKGYFWPDVARWNPARFSELPKSPLGDALHGYANGNLAKANQWGDGAWVFQVFDGGCLMKAESYDGVAITVPRAGTNVKAMEAAFFRTMLERSTYHREDRTPR